MMRHKEMLSLRTNLHSATVGIANMITPCFHSAETTKLRVNKRVNIDISHRNRTH